MKAVLFSGSLTGLVLTASTTHALAYIDPVTASFVIQGIAAGFAGIMVAFRSVRHKLFALVSGRKSDSGNPTRHDS